MKCQCKLIEMTKILLFCLTTRRMRIEVIDFLGLENQLGDKINHEMKIELIHYKKTTYKQILSIVHSLNSSENNPSLFMLE